MDYHRQLDIERDSIDVELAAALGLARALRQRRNAVSHISVLPPEILLEVFIAAAHGFGGTLPSPATCIAVTHVCRHWRKAAVGCPRLWSQLSPMSSEKMQVWVERSEGVALDVAFVDPLTWPRFLSSAVSCLSRHILRVSSLRMALYAGYASRIGRHLQVSAPSLTSLDLYYPAGYRGASSGTLEHEIFPNLFLGLAPKLRSVRLVACPLKWFWPLLSDLTDLALQSTATVSSLSVAKVLNLLSRSPHLKKLSLLDALEGVGGDDNAAYRALDLAELCLPFLTSIELTAWWGPCLTLFTKLRIPSTASVRLVILSAVEETRFNSLLSMLEFFAGRKSAAKFLSLSLQTGPSSFGCTISTATRNDGRAGSPSFPPLDECVQIISFELSYRDWDSAATEGIAEVIKRLKLRDVLQLSVSVATTGTERFTSGRWRELARDCSNVERLDVSKEAVASLLSALSLKKRRQGPRRNGGRLKSFLAFPRLRHLVIRDFDVYDSEQVERMRQCFIGRRERGSPVEWLEIRETGCLYKRDVEALQVTVGRLEWDSLEK